MCANALIGSTLNASEHSESRQRWDRWIEVVDLKDGGSQKRLGTSIISLNNEASSHERTESAAKKLHAIN